MANGNCPQQTQRTLLDWLRVECGTEKPSNKLLALTGLDSNTRGQSRKPNSGKLKWEMRAQGAGEWGGQEAAADLRTLRLAISAFCFPSFSFSVRPPAPAPPKP